MLICDKCGELVDENELETVHDRDYVNNGLGMECVRDDEFYKECNCGGDWVEATECRICGKWFNDELYIKVCEECLEDNATFENALKVGNEEECQQEIKINGYLAREYSKDQIESLLLRDLEESLRLNCNLSYREFLLDDKDYFADYLIKKGE